MITPETHAIKSNFVKIGYVGASREIQHIHWSDPLHISCIKIIGVFLIQSASFIRCIKEAHWIKKTLINMNRDAGSYQLSHISRSHAPSSCKQSKRDQDVLRTPKYCH